MEFFCFICNTLINSYTKDDVRYKYKETVGIKLPPDYHLCYICCHILHKLWTFKSMCLKRTSGYCTFSSDKGILKLQKTKIKQNVLCFEESCQLENKYIESFDYNNHLLFDEFTCSSNGNNDNLEDNYMIACSNNVNDEKLNEDGLIAYLSSEASAETYSEVNNEELLSSSKLVKKPENKIVLNDNNFIKNEITENITQINASNQMPNIQSNTLDSYHENSNIELEETDLENVKKHKSKKRKKMGYKKIVLNVAEQKAELEMRRKSKKYIEAEFKCFSCAQGFLFKDSYQAHMMRHEESNGEYRCTICKLRFAMPGLLRIHTAVHAERYRCGNCGAVIRGSARTTHGRICFPNLKDESVACHLCARLFKAASGLQQHLRRFHQSKKSNRSYPCSVCGKSYGNQAAVRTHMIKHINRKFECDQCPATFSSPYTLTHHKRRHAADGEPQQFQCDTCRSAFSTRKSLLAHRRNTMNHQSTLFECPICKRTCPNQKSLAAHMQAVHSSSKDFVCALCPARYTNRKSLVRHVGTHSGKGAPRLAVCQFCGNSFRGSSKLNRHLKQVCKKAKEAQQDESQEVFSYEILNTSRTNLV